MKINRLGDSGFAYDIKTDTVPVIRRWFIMQNM